MPAGIPALAGFMVFAANQDEFVSPVHGLCPEGTPGFLRRDEHASRKGILRRNPKDIGTNRVNPGEIHSVAIMEGIMGCENNIGCGHPVAGVGEDGRTSPCKEIHSFGMFQQEASVSGDLICQGQQIFQRVKLRLVVKAECCLHLDGKRDFLQIRCGKAQLHGDSRFLLDFFDFLFLLGIDVGRLPGKITFNIVLPYDGIDDSNCRLVGIRILLRIFLTHFCQNRLIDQVMLGSYLCSGMARGTVQDPLCLQDSDFQSALFQ